VNFNLGSLVEDNGIECPRRFYFVKDVVTSQCMRIGVSAARRMENRSLLLDPVTLNCFII
jgi:hypothetical protein